MKWLYYILLLIETVLAIYLLLPLLLLILHYIREWLGLNKPVTERKPVLQKDFNFAAVITAYRDTRFIPPLVDSLLRQTYGNLSIFIVADDCDCSDLHFQDPRVHLLKPEPAFHAKIRSIEFAIEHFSPKEDVLVILDSDNLVHPKYFEYLNRYFQQGFQAVQTQMLSKNTDTKYAKLDSIGHIYYTFLERQMRMELGISSNILGLGIAISVPLYRKITYNNKLGGFDKKLQADIVKSIPQLAFAREAVVYDEKVDDAGTLEKQRIRWLFTYFHYFRINWDILVAGIKRFDYKLFYFGFIAMRPPLLILVGLGLLFTLINFLISPTLFVMALLILFLFGLSFVLIITTQSRQKGIVRGLLYIPLMILSQVRAIFKLGKAKKDFLKTEHTRIVYIEELLQDELS